MSSHSDLLIQKNGTTSTVPVTSIEVSGGQVSYKTEQLIFENGVISGREPYDGKPDLFVSAGFINCHVHWLMDAGTGSFDHLVSDIAGNPVRKTEEAIEYAKSTLKLGITFACDKAPPGYCGTPIYQKMMQAVLRGEPMTNFIYSTWAMMSEGGFGYPYGRTVQTEKDMEIALLELTASGAKAVKIIPESPFDVNENKYSFAFPAAAFQRGRIIARENNMVFAVHAKGKESLDQCIEVEADCVEHGVTATSGQLLAFQEKNIYLGPTLDGLLCRLEYAKESGAPLETPSFEWDQVCRMVKTASTLNNGTPFTNMLFASDAGSYATPHASLRELYLLRKMGFSAESIFEMATINGAKCLKQNDKGSIAIGKRADLIFWKKNPLELSLDEWQELDGYIAGVVLKGDVVFEK